MATCPLFWYTDGMSLINSIRVGPVNYRVEQKRLENEGDREICGTISYTKGLIEVSDKVERDTYVGTLMHEIVHAAYYHSGLKQPKEREIEALTTIFTRFIQDNSEFIKLIQEVNFRPTP